MISAYISGVYLRWYVMVCVCFHGVVSVLSLCGMCGKENERFAHIVEIFRHIISSEAYL